MEQSAESRQQSTQKILGHNVSELVESSQKLLSQSKSTGKVTHSDRTTEVTHGGSYTSPLGDAVQIDDGKMRHFQQLIQNVKFHTGEMRVLQGQSEQVTAREASELMMTRNATQMEAARAYDCGPQQSGR